VFSNCEHEVVHVIRLSSVDRLHYLNGYLNLIPVAKVCRVPVVSGHLGYLVHTLSLVLVENDVPLLRELIVELLRIVLEEFLFTPTQDRMGEVEPYFIVDDPVPMEAGEVEAHMFS
jgi:hypothetical protein